jgi:uncharacterized membrane protein YhdT
MLGIPVEAFNPKWYTVDLEYEAWTVSQEAFIITMGVFANTILFSLFVLVAWLMTTYWVELPYTFYKMICWFGIATILDFILIGVVDVIDGKWKKGDAFKIFEYYNARDSHGYPGIAITAFIYLVLLFLNLIVFYYYLIFVHMAGRVIDVYKRLSGNVNHFFMPHDGEVSYNYLKWVCAKALRYNHRVTNSEETVVDEKGKRK